MASRRDPERRDRDRDEYPSKRQAPRESQPRPKLDEFWLDGEGIDRQVLQSSICRFLGPEATSRPYEYQGKAGFKIKAIRTFTPDMLDDLKSLSQSFKQENNTLRVHNRDEVRYEESKTRTLRDLPENYDYDDRDRNHHSGGNAYSGMSNAYTPEASGPAYSAMYTSAPYANSGYTMAPPSSMPAYSDGRYAQDYGYQHNARDPMPPPGYGYQAGGFADPGRLQSGPGHFQNAGPPVSRGAGMMEDPRDPRDPRYSGYDAMPGITHGGNPYGIPPRQNPSPYDTMPRDQYARPPPAEPFVSRRR